MWGQGQGQLITRKPIEADAQELEENRRSRSAKLRVVESCRQLERLLRA